MNSGRSNPDSKFSVDSMGCRRNHSGSYHKKQPPDVSYDPSGGNYMRRERANSMFIVRLFIFLTIHSETGSHDNPNYLDKNRICKNN